ncbi:MAG: hypothetical protein WAS21_00695 [Geminicoccaceae bacterium]
MLKQMTASVGGGDMPPEQTDRVTTLIINFEDQLKIVVDSSRVPRRLIRPLLPGSMFCGALENRIFIGYSPHLGMPTCVFALLHSSGVPSIQNFYNYLSDTFGQNFSVVELDMSWLELPNDHRKATLAAVAKQVIQAELVHHRRETEVIPFNPIFGPNRFPLQENLVFVIMPFSEKLTDIYMQFVKPTVESKSMICRRADDITSNNIIIADIWKSICEARFIISDITDLNPNVMYELGIAHTLGKETILMKQKDTSTKFPFDIAHIRIIDYQDTAAGGNALRVKLAATIDSVTEKMNSKHFVVS